MRENLPSPDFEAQQYERPNQKWVCGWVSEGFSCKTGPDANGRCCATFECKPAPDKLEDGKVVRWRCNRTHAQGKSIPCECGPLPNGTCCRPVPRCQPKRSLRSKRGSFTMAVITLTLGGLLLAFYGKARWQFISPGNLSLAHSGAKFKALSENAKHGDENCAGCHSAAISGPLGWIDSAFKANPHPLEFAKLLDTTQPTMSKIDGACQNCHSHHDFHQPNVAWDYSCSACHLEHQGGPQMKAASAANCITCHGDDAIMAISADKGHKIPAAAFDFQLDQRRLAFNPPRPTNGYTKTIHAFNLDHPEFQILIDRLKDTNTLRFSHETHQGKNPQMTSLNGKELDCTFCHQADSTGAYYQKVSFAKNCQICHSLHFDKDNPELTVPHGNVETVHSFLHSLKTQYADYGRRVKKLTGEVDLKKFVESADKRLRESFRSPDILEQKVFFSTESLSPETDIGRLGDKGRALYPGCAYCHEVKPSAKTVAVVTPPVMMERWLNRGRFDHLKHTSLTCQQCHEASTSKAASDIILPSKAICASCHNPETGVRNDCLTCHAYHNKKALTAGNSTSPQQKELSQDPKER